MKNIEKRSNVVCELENKKRFRVDGCIRKMIQELNSYGIITVGSCCGHNRYLLSIVCKSANIDGDYYYELITGVKIPRTRNFYVKDRFGYYYIPEALAYLNDTGGNTQ